MDCPALRASGDIDDTGISWTGDVWLRDSAYTRAREVLDHAFAQDQLLDGTQGLSCFHVMKVHKAKGKQFGGVILLRKGRFAGTQPESSFL